MDDQLSHRHLHDLAMSARLYARSKGLALVAQGVVFMVGVLPLLYTLREAVGLGMAQAGGLYAASAAFFLFTVWVGLKLVPDAVDRAYYMRIGDAHAAPRETPDWARFLAPCCLLAPIAAVGMGFMDAWQGTVLALSLFGLHMYVVGRFVLGEPATEMIGAVTVLLGGLVAAAPQFALMPQSVGAAPWLTALLHAQGAALSIVGWLGVAWGVSSIAVHAYNRWLFSEIGRLSGGYRDR